MDGFSKAILKIASTYKEQEIDNLVSIETIVQNFEVEFKDVQMPVLLACIEEGKLDKEVMEKTIDLLVERGLNDWRFGEVAVEVIVWMESNVKVLECRHKFLCLLHHHCKKYLWSSASEEAPSSSNLACLSLLSHSARLFKFADGSLIEQLVQQTSHALHALFTSADAQAVHVASQLLVSVVDVMVAVVDMKELTTLQLTIKEEIIRGRGSSEARRDLMVGLESLVKAIQPASFE